MDRTGIVRRMDELGRIVIPKEIRRVMRLEEGEEMEIFPEGDQFVVRKHSRFSALGRTVDAVVGLLAEHTGCEVFLAAAGVVTAAGRLFLAGEGAEEAEALAAFAAELLGELCGE